MSRPIKCTRCGAALPATGEMCTNCGSLVATEQSDELKKGSLLAGKYEIVEQIGAGGMGRVYKAIQQPLGTTVCVKTLHVGGTADPQFATRFQREAKTTSQLRHPNIVSVFDFGAHTDGMLYLVMEYVEGENLMSLIRQGQLMSAARAVHILSQVCDALSVAHKRNVIHRDLKPANIMLVSLPEDANFVKVLDFGSAVMLEDEEGDRLTRVGTVIGTPAYMAPEYILGRGLDARVDVYAVGVLLYTLLTGTPPFRGNAQAVFAQQVSVPAMPPRKRNPQADVSPALEAAIMRALVKDPAKRFASAAELKVAMQQALAGVAPEGFEYDGAGEARIEVAHQERPVVVVSVCAVGGMTTELTDRVAAAVQSRGGVRAAEREDSAPADAPARFVFGLDRDGPEAAAEAMRCAMDIVGLRSVRPFRVGVRDAQASCKGSFGAAGFSFDLFGAGLEVSSQLAAHAQAGTVLISGPVSRHVPPELRLTPVMPPPNVDEPAFMLTDPLQVAAQLDQLPFAGRSAEQRALLEIAVNAADGLVALLEAPAGFGKTRLVDEVVSQAARVGVLWCVAPASPDMEIGPAHPVSVIAALGWSVPGAGASTTERYAIDAMLGRTDETGDGLSGERRQLRLVSSALDGVSRRVEHGPVVIVFDQLHLADDLTWAVARRMIDMAPVLGVSVVLSVRDANDVPFPVPQSARRITLAPLTDKEIESLASSSEAAGLDDATIGLLVRASGGVPLLAEEIFRTASRGNTEIVRDLTGLEPDAAVRRLVQLRVAGLDMGALLVLHAAAILGLAPREREVCGLVGDETNFAAALAELQAAALLTKTVSGRLAFLFPLAQDVVLESLTDEARAELHRRAAERLRAQGAGILRLGELGAHLLRAGDADGALSALHGAADRARAEGATRRAIDHLHLAIRAGDQLGEARGEERAVVAKKLGELLIQSGRLPEAEAMLRWSFPKARAHGAHGLAADLLRLHGRVLVLQGHRQEGQGEIEATLRFGEENSLVTLAAEACGDLADVHDGVGQQDLAAEALRKGLDLIEAREDRDASAIRIQLYNRLGRLELQREKLPSAIALFTQALTLAERTQDRYQSAGLLGNLGGAYARRGELNRAIHFTERALRASEALGDQIGVARQSHNLALLRLATGQQATAKQLLRSSHDAARRAGWRQGLDMSTSALAKLGETP